MGENRTSEQVREEHLRDMGPRLGAVYDALYNDISWLHMRWKLYRQLFANSPERLDLLNEAAGLFFHVLQEDSNVPKGPSLTTKKSIRC